MKTATKSGGFIVKGLIAVIVVLCGALGGLIAFSTTGGQTAMQIHYLEIVTKEVDEVCAAYAAAHGVRFTEPDSGLGFARTAPLPGGGLVGVRAPLRETEQPVVRPYWLVDDIQAAVAAVEKAGGTIALPPMEIPGHGTCAIYILGGIDHGLWQK